jgi:hypothetical protein
MLTTKLVKLASLAVVSLALPVAGCASDTTEQDPQIGTATNGNTPVGVPYEVDPTMPVQQKGLPILARDPKVWDTVQQPEKASRAELPGETPERH